MRLVLGPVDCCFSDIKNRGFERSGENNENEVRRPYFEGAWMNKHNGKYYLTYAAPGTEYGTYADGCFVSDSPMGPFVYCDNSPVVWKATGFMRGSGHGCLFEDLKGNWWKVDTVSISVNHMFERRLALFPAKFGADGRLYTNTLRGDYPMYIPTENETPFDVPGPDWALLSYGKNVKVSSVLDDAHAASFAVDENMKTLWSASTGDAGEFISLDLGKEYSVRSIQLNYADCDTYAVHGRDNDFCYKYRLEYSLDGEKWTVIRERTDDAEDRSHEYIELDGAVLMRYVRLTNLGEIPAGGKFAISGLRVFGNNDGNAPEKAPEFNAVRGEDKRNMTVKWDMLPDAQGYFVRFGVNPNELNTHYQVIGGNEAVIGCLNNGVNCYVTVDAYNEDGVTEGKRIVMLRAD